MAAYRTGQLHPRAMTAAAVAAAPGDLIQQQHLLTNQHNSMLTRASETVRAIEQLRAKWQQQSKNLETITPNAFRTALSRDCLHTLWLLLSFSA